MNDERAGHIYVVEFSDTRIKVGRTAKPADRLYTHSTSARAFGLAIGRTWVSPIHNTSIGNERGLINFCATRATDRSGEFFAGVAFDDAVDFAESMPFPLPGARADKRQAILSHVARGTGFAFFSGRRIITAGVLRDEFKSRGWTETREEIEKLLEMLELEGYLRPLRRTEGERPAWAPSFKWMPQQAIPSRASARDAQDAVAAIFRAEEARVAALASAADGDLTDWDTIEGALGKIARDIEIQMIELFRSRFTLEEIACVNCSSREHATPACPLPPREPGPVPRELQDFLDGRGLMPMTMREALDSESGKEYDR